MEKRQDADQERPESNKHGAGLESNIMTLTCVRSSSPKRGQTSDGSQKKKEERERKKVELLGFSQGHHFKNLAHVTAILDPQKDAKSQANVRNSQDLIKPQEFLETPAVAEFVSILVTYNRWVW